MAAIFHGSSSPAAGLLDCLGVAPPNRERILAIRIDLGQPHTLGSPFGITVHVDYEWWTGEMPVDQPVVGSKEYRYDASDFARLMRG